MPALATRMSAPTVADDVLNLPPNFPEVPPDVLKRFPSLVSWEEEVGSFWMKARQVLNDGIQSHSNAIGKIVKPDNGNLRVLIDNLQAAVNTETLARIAGDVALAASITTVVASVGTKSRISVQSVAPSTPAINDLWLDTSDSNRYKFWDGLVWQYKQDLVLAAAVSTESIARATADGYLEGKYTLTVVAGNVVTGMNITSASGGGSIISSVIFRAADFKIYNSITGVAMFTVSGTEIKLGDTLTVDTANSKVFIGAGHYANNDTPFFVDDAGNFSLGGALTWDGTTLSITSPPTVTVDWTTQVTSRPTELTDGRIATALNSAGLVISGAHPGINVTTGAAGLYLGADFLGYYNGSSWRTYMDNSGHFYLGGTSGALQWNGTTLSITGNITVSGGNAAKTDFSNVTAAYAGSPSTGGAANTIVGQGALATVNSASWTTQVSARPVELTDGRIAVAISSAGGVLLAVNAAPSGSGLFIGNNFLGYYTGGSWRTYMDNSGNFYLGGVSGNLQWNGTTLTINGGGTFSGALSAATGTFAGSLSAATGTFSGSLSAATGTFAGSLSAATGTFSGALSGATGTFSGSLSAATGTFSGSLSGATGTFSGSLSAATGSFSGSISASSGTIGGFTIGASQLTATNLTLDSSGFIRYGTPSGTSFVEISSGNVDFYNSSGYLGFVGGFAPSGGDLTMDVQSSFQATAVTGTFNFSTTSPGVSFQIGNSSFTLNGGITSLHSIDFYTGGGGVQLVENWGLVYSAGDSYHPFKVSGASIYVGGGSPATDYGSGNIYIAGYGYGDFTSFSTRLWKDNIRPLLGASTKMRNLAGWMFEYNDNAPERMRGRTDVGTIAEDVLVQQPELVVRDANGTLAVNYPKFAPLFIEAWKDHDSRIEALEATLAARQSG